MIPLKDDTPSRTWPFVNILLIIANIAAFVYEVQLSSLGTLDAFIQQWAVIPNALVANPADHAPRILASMFLHGGWLHCFGNLLYLYIFGDNVEDRMGHFRYLFFYLFCGTFATLTQVYFSVGSQVPLIGASGAIAGVLGAYFVLFPFARIVTLVPIFIFLKVLRVPAFVLLGFWFFIQAWSGTLSLGVQARHADVGGVAWWAHAGGFICGLVLVLFFARHPKRR